MAKSIFNSMTGRHYIKDHEDMGGFTSRKEAQEGYKKQSYSSGKSDGYKGYPPEEHKNTDWHKGQYLKGHSEGRKEHEQSHWGKGEGNKNGDIK